MGAATTTPGASMLTTGGGGNTGPRTSTAQPVSVKAITPNKTFLFFILCLNPFSSLPIRLKWLNIAIKSINDRFRDSDAPLYTSIKDVCRNSFLDKDGIPLHRTGTSGVADFSAMD
jgi:hypothetical protein